MKVRELIEALQVLPPASSVVVLCHDGYDPALRLANDVTKARLHKVHSNLVVLDLGCDVTANGSWGTIWEEPHD